MSEAERTGRQGAEEVPPPEQVSAESMVALNLQVVALPPGHPSPARNQPLGSILLPANTLGIKGGHVGWLVGWFRSVVNSHFSLMPARSNLLDDHEIPAQTYPTLIRKISCLFQNSAAEATLQSVLNCNIEAFVW
jgi:hypothetical protein